jgi:MFS family permease
MGLHNSALTVGVALGAPLAGLVMDTWSPPWGFAAVGGLGLLVTLAVLPAELRHRREASGAQPSIKEPSARRSASHAGPSPAPAALASATRSAFDAGESSASGAPIGSDGHRAVLGSADTLEAGAAGPAVELPR